MLWILLKQQFLSLLSSFRIGRRRNGVATRRSLPATLLILALLGYCGICFAIAFFGIFLTLFQAVIGTENAWLGFAVMGLLVFLIDFVMTIFTAKNQIFEAKDNELLLSLPIRPRDILLSRMLAILLTDYLFEILIAVPAYIAWVVAGGFSPASLVCFILTAAVMPLLALSLSCLVGWVLSLITSRMKNAALLNTVLSLALLGGYLALCLGMQSYMQTILTNMSAIAPVIKKFFYPFYCLGDACANGNALSAFIYITVMVLPFVLTCFILAHTFFFILTRRQGGARRAYREVKTRVRPLAVALVVRELRHLFSSTGYLINAGLGVVMLPVLGVGFFFMKESLAVMADGLGIAQNVFLPAVAVCTISLVGGLVVFTAPSVSLEGQSIYDIKALPLSGVDFLMAKVYMQMLIVTPVSLLTSVLGIIAMPCSFAMGVLLVLVPPIFHLAFTLIGLAMNLAFPRFDWDNETVVVKQSLSVTLTMLANLFGGSLVISGGLLLLIFVPVIPAWASILLMTLVPIAVSAALLLLIVKKGNQLVANLG